MGNEMGNDMDMDIADELMPNGWNRWSRWVFQNVKETRADVKEIRKEIHGVYEKLDDKIGKIVEKFGDKDVKTNERVTNLYIKVAGLSAAVSILTVFIINYVMKK